MLLAAIVVITDAFCALSEGDFMRMPEAKWHALPDKNAADLGLEFSCGILSER